MKLTKLWKDRMKASILATYGDRVDMSHLDTYLDAKIKESLQVTRVMRLRNIYTDNNFNLHLNDALNYAEANKASIIGNGSFVVNSVVQESDLTTILRNDMIMRKKYKKEMVRYTEAGDKRKAALYDTLQTLIKETTNSIYGASGLNGSFLFSVDAASAITSQSTQLIAESLSAFEKFFGGNVQFMTLNEAISFYTDMVAEPHFYEKYIGWIYYIPTKGDVKTRMSETFSTVPDMNPVILSDMIDRFVANRSTEELTYLYYKNNIRAFIMRNPRISAIFVEILTLPDSFLDPYSIPESFVPKIAILQELLFEFVAFFTTTTYREEKYRSRPRDVVIVSDTDSDFLCLQELVEVIYEVTKVPQNSDTDFKVINTIMSIGSAFIAKILGKFLEKTNTIVKYPDFPLSMKNEFYYKRLVIFAGIQKNYSGYMLLKEGRNVPPHKQISHTGLKLTAASTQPDVAAAQEHIVGDLILRSDHIDPVQILLAIETTRKMIKDRIELGDKTFGRSLRLGNLESYANIESNQAATVAEVWNRLYPDDQILPGEYMYVFPTVVRSEYDLSKIKDPTWKELLTKRIFCASWNGMNNDNIRRKGISNIAVPRDGETLKIPKWIVDIIDKDEVARSNLTPLIDILGSISLTRSRINSGKFTYSELIQI